MHGRLTLICATSRAGERGARFPPAASVAPPPSAAKTPPLLAAAAAAMAEGAAAPPVAVPSPATTPPGLAAAAVAIGEGPAALPLLSDATDPASGSTEPRTFVAPDAAAREVAVRRGLVAAEDAALREIDHGRWAGRRLADVAAAEPAAFAAWLADPAAAPHGGESVAEAFARTSAWLALQLGRPGDATAIVGAPVLRLLLCAVLHADLAALHAIDVEPGAEVVLTSDGRRFRLRLRAG